MEYAQEMQELGLSWLTSLYRKSGLFPVRFTDPPASPRHYAWTSAEAVVAFFEARENPPPGSIEAVLKILIKASLDSARGGKLVPALGEFQLQKTQGIIDSTARAVVALSEIRYHMLRDGKDYYQLYSSSDRRVSTEQLAELQVELLTGLEKNMNDDGGWGTFYGETSRTDPTSHALAALIRYRSNAQSYHNTIQSAIKWLKDARFDRGWGATANSGEADPGNTALALSAIAMELPMTHEIIVNGAQYLVDCVADGKVDDVTADLKIGYGGMGPIHQGICIPSAPRMLQALLACGRNPTDDAIQKLISEMHIRRRKEDVSISGAPEVYGWGLDAQPISTWYTSIVIYSCSDYLRYVRFAGTRIDDVERTLLITRIEDTTRRLRERQVGDYNHLNITKCKRVTYAATWACAGMGILLSLAVYFLGEITDQNFMKWLAGVFSVGVFVSVLTVTFGYLGKVFSEKTFQIKEREGIDDDSGH